MATLEGTQRADARLCSGGAQLRETARWLLGSALRTATVLLLGVVVAWGQSQADPEQALKQPGATQQMARAPGGMVASANAHATAAGLALLRRGGNAVDATVAAQFVLNVVEPQSSGIGGGGFMLIYLAKQGKVVAIDGREEAPAAATADMFLGPDGKAQRFYPERISGGNAVGAPGLLLALEKALARHGSMSLSQVLAPAIGLAEGGFAVSPRLASSLVRHQQRLGLFAATRRLYFQPSGETLAAGSWWVQPELAATFRLIAEKGSEAFYRGAIARDVVTAVRGAALNPGRMRLTDLARYDAPWRRPTHIRYGAYSIHGMGPPSSGGVTTLQMLQLLKAAPPALTAAVRIHHFVQAARLAYADRARYVADADFVQVPLAGLLDPAYAQKRATAHPWQAPLAPVHSGRPAGALAFQGLDEEQEGHSTTHISVVDAGRNMVALTSSIEQAFGSGMVVRGFLLNNQLTDFSSRHSDEQGNPVANRVSGGKKLRRTALERPQAKGGKRPRSSMAPTLVLHEGRPLLTLGSPGGSRIIQYTARVLIDVLDKRRSLAEAIAAGHVTHLGGVTTLEPALAKGELPAALRQLGHRVRIAEQNSGLQGIWIDPHSGMLEGAADPRREGTAQGY